MLPVPCPDKSGFTVRIRRNMQGTCWKSKICDLAVAKTSIKWRCYWILGKIVLLDGYLMDRDRLVVAKRRPLRPSPGLQPDTRRWRAFVCRPSGRPASTKHTSATAARRSLAAPFTSLGCGYAMSLSVSYLLPSAKHSPPSLVGHGRGLVTWSGCNLETFASYGQMVEQGSII